MEQVKRVPPHNQEAEQVVLGAMMLSKDAIHDVLEVLKGREFYRQAHEKIYVAILDLYNENEPVDSVTVANRLGDAGIFEEVGGHDYLSFLLDMGMITTDAKAHAKIVKEKYVLRELIGVASEIMETGYQSEDPKVVLDVAEQRIFDISQDRSAKTLSPIGEIVTDTYTKIQEVHKNPGNLTGISTGFKYVDEKTSGLQRSDLVLIAARPSMGKTAFSINLCQHAALKGGGTVAIFSLEMAKEQLVQRMLASEAMVSIGDIRNGTLEADDWVRLASAGAKLSQAKIFIDDTPALTVSEIRAKTRRLKMQQGLDLIMIDYLQLMSGGGRSESRQQEISTISRSLKALARDLDCPVVALSQLSRAPELRADHRPILSDLRESGAIEQDADVVMFLYRDEYYFGEESEYPGEGEVIIAKQRNGETGKIHLAWVGKYTKFVDKEPSYGTA